MSSINRPPAVETFEIGGDVAHEKPQEACGVFGVASDRAGAVYQAYDALVTLVNRGEQAAGIGTIADGRPISIADEGPAPVAFQEGNSIAGYSDTKVAIGHTLYSTQKTKELQPIPAHDILLAHNGNILNKKALARRYGVEITEKISDSGVLAQAIGNQKRTLGSTEEALKEVLPRVSGAFSLVILDGDRIIAARDRAGWRPLEVGELNEGGWAVASETPVFDMIDAQQDHFVAPGTYEVIDKHGVQETFRWADQLNPNGSLICGMEFAYFARADGEIEGTPVSEARERMGMLLAEDHPVDADIVIPIPDSGRQVATGLAKVLGLVCEDGFFKNHILGRSYIKPVNQIRKAVKLKLNPITAVVKGKKLIAGEDSSVRGATTKEKIRDLKRAGAREVHMRYAFPPIRYSCPYGMNMSEKDGFIAAGRTDEEIAKEIGADSAAYLASERFEEAVGRPVGAMCMACVTGKYPQELPEEAKAEFGRSKPALTTV